MLAKSQTVTSKRKAALATNLSLAASFAASFAASLALPLSVLISSPSFAADGVAVDQDWLTLREITLDIKPDSPLDLSQLFPDQAGPIKHPVQINSEGNFTVAGKEQRFLCALMVLTQPYGGFPDKALADRYAAQLKRSGYNLVRMMQVETSLMTDRDVDFGYDPEQMDRMHYFLSALKREGVYWMIDGMTSENGSYGGIYPHRWIKKHNLLARIYTDPVAQQHWRDQVERMLGKVNPYTGKSILQDDAMMGLLMVNEGGLQFLAHLRKKVPDEVVPRLTQWLKARYPKAEAFEKVWKQPLSVLDSGALKLPSPADRSPQMDDVLQFYLELQTDTGKWMEAHLRKLGYKGPTTTYNNNPSTTSIRARANFRWADMHYYHDEAYGFAVGAKMRNDSSFDKNLQHITGLAMSQLSGRAFTVSEYGQPFWNEWRRETAVVPAYAALHNWDGICHYASTSVDVTYAHSKGFKQYVVPYAIGLDPVARASETLAALLYRRGDVKTSVPFAEVSLPGGPQENSARYWGLPRDVERHALVMRTQTRIEDEAGSKPLVGAAARLSTVSESKVGRKVDQLLAKIGGPLNDKFGSKEKDALENAVKAAAPSNLTDTSAGIFQSVTGELLTDMKARRFEVRTAKTEALIFDELPKAIKLGTLSVKESSAPALVSLSSLDGLALDKSKKMLLIVATDALNTGMRFANSKRQELVQLGRLPVRIKPIKIELEIAGKGGVKVQAMRQNGELMENLPAKEGALSTTVELDMTKLANGPGFYYYLTR